MNINELDLTQHSETFDSFVSDGEIPLDSKLREIKSSFSNHLAIVVCGPHGSGKTTHLSHFVRSEKAKCISYFLRDDPWTLRQDAFLRSLCIQISVVLGQGLVNFETDVDRLKSIFQSLTARLIQRAKASRSTYYFVVDGLELALKGIQGDRIFDLFPLPVRQKSLYFLGSIDDAAESDLSIKFHKHTPHLFSSLETETYLHKTCHTLNLTEPQITTIHNLSDGLPGYLATIALLLLDGRVKVDHLDHTPGGLEPLLDLKWKSLQTQQNELIRSALEFMAFASKPLETGTLSQILGVDEKLLGNALLRTGIVRETLGCFHFYPDLYRRIAQSKLREHEHKTIKKLADYYQDNKPEDRFLLADYYTRLKDYHAVARLLEPIPLVATIHEQKGFGTTIKQLKKAIELVFDADDLPELLRFSIASSQLRTLSNKLSGELEIRALVAMKDYKRALSRVYSIGVAEIRVKLLSYIYLAMEADGKTVSREDLFELEQLANEVTRSIDADAALEIAVEIFPLLPESATQIIDNAKIEESTKSTLDLVAALAALRARDQEDEHLIDRIGDTEIKELALVGGKRLYRLSVEKILQRAEKATHTKAKEYLLRQWLLENRRHPEAYIVVNAALDVTINDPDDYRVPLRNLRQLSECVKYCPAEYRTGLIRRFEAPVFTSLNVPFEERLHLNLNLIEALWDIDQTQAITRLTYTYDQLEATNRDVDVLCYSYALLFVTASRIDPANRTDWGPKWKARLEDLFVNLLDTSAEQYKVSKRVLKALCRVDPNLAIEFARMQNLLSRREKSIQDVLSTYARQEDIPVNIHIIQKGIDEITIEHNRNRAIRKVIQGLRESKRFENVNELKEAAIELTKSVSDPIVRCQCFAQIVATMKSPSEEQLRQELMSSLVNSWGDIDVLWQKVEAGFDLVRDIAESDLPAAQWFYGQISSLRSSSILANQSLGTMLYSTLSLTGRFACRLDIGNPEVAKVWRQLFDLIDKIPSSILRADIYAQCALGRLRVGDRASFDSLIRDRVLPEISGMPQSDTKNRSLLKIIPAIYEYSREEAVAIVNRLPYDFQNDSWVITGIHLLRQSNINDPIGHEVINSAIDIRCANDIQFILECMERDNSLHFLLERFIAAIKNPNSQLTEQQRLDKLFQLESIIERKLPDPKNIRHPGYKIVLQAEIETGIRSIAKRSKPEILKQRSGKLQSIADDARRLENIADKVFVLVHIAKSFDEVNNTLASDLLSEAEKQITSIPNVEDRMGRLDDTIEVFYKLKDANGARRLVELANSMSAQLAGVALQAIRASLIQTVHQFDEDIAAKLTEKIEDKHERYELTIKQKSMALQRDPNKLARNFDDFMDEDVLSDAAGRLLTSLVDRRGVIHTEKTLAKWVTAFSYVGFDTASKIADWIAESLMRQRSPGALQESALSFTKSLLLDSLFLLELGKIIDSLADVPDDLKGGYRALSPRTAMFEVGERDKVINWIRQWVGNNVKGYIKICDPFFDSSQLWILQCIPSDITVQIVTSKKPKHQVSLQVSEDELKQEYKTAWRKISDQSPPPTLVVIHQHIFGSVDDDSFHDRYITTEGTGLIVGTSLNGFGNKQFLITAQSQEDAEDVERQYINPKLDISKYFMKSIFLKLE